MNQKLLFQQQATRQNADSLFSGGRIIVIDNQTSRCSFNGDFRLIEKAKRINIYRYFRKDIPIIARSLLNSTWRAIAECYDPTGHANSHNRQSFAGLLD